MNGEMLLSHIGKIAESEWLKTFEIRPDMNLTMGVYVVMPNHFHAIIGIGQNKFAPQSKNLASIVRGFKIGVTKNARLIHADFGWQTRFHDHIVCDDGAYQRISNYIINNPKNWKEDTFHK